jgi:hypothetical protein
MSSVVSVWTRWGDYALGVRDVRRGQTLRVGSPPRRLVRCEGDATTVWLDEGVRTLKAGDGVRVERDGVHYFVSCAEVRGREGLAAGCPWRELLTVALGLGLVTLGLLSGRERPERWREHFVGFAELPPPRVESKATPVVRTELSVATEPQASALRTPGDMRCGALEMGQSVADSAPGRHGVAGPKDNPDPRLARPDQGIGYPITPDGLIVVVAGFAHVPVGNDAPTAPWGRREELGTDERSARGEVWGERLDEAWGDQGLGVAARPGGVLKRMDAAPISIGGERGLRVLHTGLRVVGPRKASEVGRAMSALFEDFKSCAARANLGEQRRVELSFEVEPDGRVVRGAVQSDGLEACLGERVVGAKFTAGAPAVARVHYPLYFMPAADELRSPQVTPAAPPAPCDCGS